MKRFFTLLLVVLLAFCCVYADDGIQKVPKKLNGIGKVSRYKIGDNIYVGTNFNVEMLFIAAATGSKFSHRGYGNSYELQITDRFIMYYSKYINNTYAKKLYEYSLTMTDNSSNKFSTSTVIDMLLYKEVLADGLNYSDVSVRDPKTRTEVASFYKETRSKKFLRKNLSLYNKMVDDFVTKYSFDHVKRLETFFGVTTSDEMFEIVLSPMMNGGQAVEFKEQNKIHNINIINPTYKEPSILNLLYHETAHNFLTPILNRNKELINGYSQYSNAIITDKTSYLNMWGAVSETLARSITIYMLEKYHNPLLAQLNMKNELNSGWKGIDDIYSLIKNKYDNQQDLYPTFESFFPVIMEYIKAASLGQPFDIGPQQRMDFKKLFLVGGKEGWEVLRKYIEYPVVKACSENLLPLSSFGNGDKTISVIYHINGNKSLDGQYQDVLGYNYQELIDTTQKQGKYQRVFQNGSKTTIVFGADSVIALDTMISKFDFSPYLTLEPVN